MKSGIYGFPNQTSSNISVVSYNGRTGSVVSQAGDYTAVMVGADVSGTAVNIMSIHSSDIDPHNQYQTEVELESILDDLILTYNNTINV